MEAGFNRYRIAMKDIVKFIDVSSEFHAALVPNGISDGCELFFGAIDFVKEANTCSFDETLETSVVTHQKSAGHCKCVIWDLDNTLWDGILVEDGIQALHLKPQIKETLDILDRHGILISAASKNEFEIAIAALRHFGIAKYFIFPQISWNPKSDAIRRIANFLSIGMNSILFVDDSPFERAQVLSAYPEVMTLDATQYHTLANRPECRLPITKESESRRAFYQDQEIRNSAAADLSGDPIEFLRISGIRLTIRPMTSANLNRVQELTQRANQLNFSGNIFTRDQLSDLLLNHNFDAYAIDCNDCYGAYGTIGFCAILRSENLMTDLIFSCRVRGKQVEHAFLTHILRSYRKRMRGDFFANYRMTERNACLGAVFAAIGFEAVDSHTNITMMVFRSNRTIPANTIVSIDAELS